MAKFPDVFSIGYQYIDPLDVELVAGKTLISQFDDLGEEKRRQKQLYPTRNITVNFDALLKTGDYANTLWTFYKDRGGSFEAFNFFYPYSDTYEGEYVGTGDSATTSFNLPAKSSASYTLNVDSAEQSIGSDYNFSGEAGTDGADKIVFISPPSSGERITWDFTGNLKIRTRFAQDIFSYTDFYDYCLKGGLRLKGLLNE